ncbi:hypothetical protein [Sulfurimonas sp.]|uniref:hypothetical protein n=1 Tax=Sulfurimonas sp. TaxID=2022749 RepID=UPI002B4722C8|nr:hypothetical protein [Sulfurimonas sp.]
MKKIIIALFVVIAIVAILPLIGNKATQEILTTRVSVLTSNGLELKNASSESTYLRTKKHYEFLLRDAPKFIKHLNQYSDVQLPPYVDAMLGGVLVGVDIEYSNFPLGSDILVDIYPLSLSTNMISQMKKEDVNFYKYIENLLQSKGVLYHISYSVADGSFSGFIKNIDENYTFDNSTKMIFKLREATYYGKGPLIAPKSLQSHISEINLEVIAPTKNIMFNFKNIASSSTFHSSSTYASSATIKTLVMNVKEKRGEETKVKVDDAKFNISSNTQGEKAEFYTKSSFKEFEVKSDKLNLLLNGFNYDVSLDGVDKIAYEEFRKLTLNTKSNNSQAFEKELQEAIIKIFSKGLELNIADFSVKKLSLENETSIDAFSLMAKLNVKQDNDLAKKIKSSPMTLINNINIDSTIKLSKDFYVLINKKVPITGLANSFAKEEGNNLIFVIKLIDGKLSLNDKVIK